MVYFEFLIRERWFFRGRSRVFGFWMLGLSLGKLS